MDFYYITNLLFCLFHQFQSIRICTGMNLIKHHFTQVTSDGARHQRHPGRAREHVRGRRTTGTKRQPPQPTGVLLPAEPSRADQSPEGDRQADGQEPDHPSPDRCRRVHANCQHGHPPVIVCVGVGPWYRYGGLPARGQDTGQPHDAAASPRRQPGSAAEAHGEIHSGFHGEEVVSEWDG